jgi:hypothetical protein
MLQLNSVANVGVHRTCTPLYEKYEATPYNTFLDPAETGNVYSGFVMARTGPDTVALLGGVACSGVAAQPFGLSCLDRNANIDDTTQVGINVWAVWLGGSNAFFTLTAPAFDTSASYAVATTGARVWLYPSATTPGQLTSVSGTAQYQNPVAELVNVYSPTQISIRLIDNVNPQN